MFLKIQDQGNGELYYIVKKPSSFNGINILQLALTGGNRLSNCSSYVENIWRAKAHLRSINFKWKEKKWNKTSHKSEILEKKYPQGVKKTFEFSWFTRFVVTLNPCKRLTNSVFSWKLRSVWKFWIQDKFCTILASQDICETKWDLNDRLVWKNQIFLFWTIA